MRNQTRTAPQRELAPIAKEAFNLASETTTDGERASVIAGQLDQDRSEANAKQPDMFPDAEGYRYQINSPRSAQVIEWTRDHQPSRSELDSQLAEE